MLATSSPGYSYAADVYSFGVTAWEVITHQPLYPGLMVWDVVGEVCNGRRPDVSLIPFPQLATLLEDCWHQNPGRRPTFDQILSQLEEISFEEDEILEE